MEKEYAQSLRESVGRGTDEAKLVDGLIRHLKEEGRMKLLPGILKELKAMDAHARKSAISVEVASEGEMRDALLAARAAGIDSPTAIVNPSLIRGWRAREGSVLVDRSAKQALVDLYQKITN